MSENKAANSEVSGSLKVVKYTFVLDAAPYMWKLQLLSQITFLRKDTSRMGKGYILEGVETWGTRDKNAEVGREEDSQDATE